MSDEIVHSSPALEQRLLSYLNDVGAPVMQMCAERGVSSATFSGTREQALFEVAESLHAKQLLFEGGVALGEEAVERRKVMTWQDYVSLTNQRPLGISLVEAPTICRELKRLEKQRVLKHANLALSQALKDGDQEKVTEAMAAINATDLTERPRATWHQVGGVEIERAAAVIAGKEDPDVRSIPWPWRALDIDLHQFRRSEQVVVAGYTSHGKSSLLRQLCVGAAVKGHNVAMVSMEVPAADVFNLMASAHSGQPWSRLKGLHPRDQREFLQGAQQVRGMSIEVLDDQTSLPGIAAWLRNQHARRFLDVIAVDYLGLVAECSPQRGQNKAAAVGEVAGAFKRIATELGVVLFLAVQINRGPQTDGNREPRLSDLKDSGDIEAHADRVLLLFRPDDDKANDCPQATHESLQDRPRFYMELFQEKGRNVGTGITALWFRRELAKFELIA